MGGGAGERGGGSGRGVTGGYPWPPVPGGEFTLRLPVGWPRRDGLRPLAPPLVPSHIDALFHDDLHARRVRRGEGIGQGATVPHLREKVASFDSSSPDTIAGTTTTRPSMTCARLPVLNPAPSKSQPVQVGS